MTKDPIDKRPTGTKDPIDKRPNDKRPNWQKTHGTKDPPGQKTQLTKDTPWQKTQLPRKKDPILPAEFRSKLKIRKQKIRKSAKNCGKTTQFKAEDGLAKVKFQVFLWYTITIHTFIIQIVFYIVHNSILLTYAWTNVCLISIFCIKRYMLRNW